MLPDYYNGVPITGTHAVQGVYPLRNKNITSVTIPETFTLLVNRNFAQNLLTSITIPSNIKQIHGRAFDSNNLTNVVIEDGVNEIWEYAFTNNNLTEIILPKSITLMQANVFYNNPNLTTITVYKDSYAEQWAKDNGYSVKYVKEPSVLNLNGTINPTILSVTVPTTLAFTINPNDLENSLISSELTITNNTNAQVEVLVNKFEVSGGYTSLMDVLPTRFTDQQWSELNRFDSEHNIALALQPIREEDWAKIELNPVWAKTVQDIGYRRLGVLKPNSVSSLTVIGKHGRLFSEQIDFTYAVCFVLSLE